MEPVGDGAPVADFQPSGTSWEPTREDAIRLLQTSRHTSTRPIYHGSNHTFLVTLDGGPAGESLAVYKPAMGETPLYDFPDQTLYRREAAMWLLDTLLSWRLVPPTAIGSGQYGIGSVQLFIEAAREAEIEIVELQRMALLDVVANNADRKPEHCLVSQTGKLWGIDHGLTFNAHPKLRTILWHFAGDPIPDAELTALRDLSVALAEPIGPHAARLVSLLDRAERRALRARVDGLLSLERFPDPRYKSVPYRW